MADNTQKYLDPSDLPVGAEIIEAKSPVPRREKPAPRMDERQSLIRAMIEEAVQYRQENLDPDQAEATDYYFARDFGNEEQGRSQVVMSEVRDAIQAILPSLMRVFAGPERFVEYRPRGPEDEDAARQATDYVNFVLMEDNQGFAMLHAAFKDALVRKTGIVKWWWEDRTKREVSHHSGLSDEAIAVIQSQLGEEDEVRDLERAEDGTLSLKLVRVNRDGRARVTTIPPEELIFSPSARSIEEARLVGHSRYLHADELVEMGVDRAIVERHAGRQSIDTFDDQLEDARRFDEGARRDRSFEDAQDKATRPTRYVEAYVLVDWDDDGDAELRRVACIGDTCEIVEDEEVDERPFAILTPDPEPHTLIGQSIADYLKDLQKIKSMVWRGMLDSLALSLDSRVAAQEGEVNLGDLLNPEIGGVIRTRRRPAEVLQEFSHRFVGADALPMLQMLDEVKENRTGISKAAAGLDADALQSATKAAVAATLSAAQQHIEMIARVFAELGLKPVFKGLLRLIVKHQDFARTVRLRNEWVQVDPRHWDATMDVTVNVALGAGQIEEKLQLLALVAGKQEQLLATGSPLVSNVEYRNTLSRFVELAGFKNSAEFFRPWGPQQEAQLQQALAQQPQQPDPNMALVEVERLRAQAEIAVDAAKLQLERQKFQDESDRKRDELAQEFALRERELELKYQAQILDAELKAQVAARRSDLDADVKLEGQRLKVEAEEETSSE